MFLHMPFYLTQGLMCSSHLVSCWVWVDRPKNGIINLRSYKGQGVQDQWELSSKLIAAFQKPFQRSNQSTNRGYFQIGTSGWRHLFPEAPISKIISHRDLKLIEAVKLVGSCLGWATKMVGKQFICFTSTSLHAALPEQENTFLFLCNRKSKHITS